LLGIFTFLEMEEVRDLGRREGADLRESKHRLALEATAITHGREEALMAERAAHSAFDARGSEGLPTTVITAAELAGPVLDLFVRAGLAGSRGEARRLVAQGGATINERRILNEREPLLPEEIAAGEVVLRAGKKKFHRLVVGA
jgi:tyrosyl-tRNA synthetase